jgi:uncharacterized membrane protein
MKKLILLAALVFVSVTFTVAQFTVTSIDFPGGTLTTARGINNHGEIVGAYRIVPPRHALLIKGGQYIPLAPTTVLGTNYSEAFKNNDRGDVVGEYLDDAGFTHGFLLSKKGVLTTLDFPGSSDTAAWGINESGTVVGNWDLLDSGGNLIATHGFAWDNGSFTQVDFPGSANTSVFGINARGDLVGEWDDGIVGHGFIRTNTNQFASFDVPVGGAQFTQLDDINANGQLLGVYIDAGGAEHGFLKAGAMFTSIDYPGAVTTTAWGINSAGKMVGNWYDSSGAAHGWLAQTQGSTSLLFKADFNTNVLPSTLEESGPSPIYADGAVTFPDYWNESRRYLRTKANYNTTNFIAEVTVTIQGGYGGPGIAFFGLGAGVADPNFYLEPRVPPTAYARIEPDDFGDGALSITTSSLENIGNIVEAAGDGTHRVRIIWDHVNRTFTVAIQKNYTGGPFSPTSTIQAVVHESFGDINTRIFFGGAGYSVWDDLWVLALNGTPRMSNCHGQSVSGLTQQFSGMDHAASAFGFASVNVLQNVIRDFCGN